MPAGDIREQSETLAESVRFLQYNKRGITKTQETEALEHFAGETVELAEEHERTSARLVGIAQSLLNDLKTG